MNIKKYAIISLCMFLKLGCAFCSINLEEGIQNFVLETKRIYVPGYPHAFNPSIIRWNGQLLMSFRILPDPKRTFHSEIGVVWLDDNFCPISTPQILNLAPKAIPQGIPSRAADGRLVLVGETLYLVYEDNRDAKITKGGFRVYIAKLDIVDQTIIPTEMEPILNFEGENPNLREKNWVPFAYQDKLLLAYSISPHRIFRYLPGTNGCETFAETKPEYNWDFGILRGSTPAININDQFYLSFFHSSTKMKTIHSNGLNYLHYFIGAYTFSLEPPFEILEMSSEPIIGENFYYGEIYKPYWHPICCVFPCGYIAEKDRIFIFYGRQDHEIWVATIDKNGLLNSLKPVNNTMD